VRSRTDKDGTVIQEVELRLAPTTPALELALRHFGMLRDKLEFQEPQMMQFDWDSLWRVQSEQVDIVEQRLLREEERPAAIIPNGHAEIGNPQNREANAKRHGTGTR
jgi:hypothetical protein